jgi:hypothetical protein
MNRIFAPYLNNFVVIYLDDILVYGKDAAEHAENLEKVLKVLEDEGFYAKLSKCAFNKPEVKFLGHVIGRKGVSVNPSKIAVVKEWPTPTNTKQIQQFWGLTNYFRKFIQGYSSLAAPLSELTRLKGEYGDAWLPVHAAAFEALKAALTSAPVLRLPDFELPFEVVSDASMLGTGAVLMQEGHPIAYTSKKYIPAEKNYTTTEQEMLGVVHALAEWRCYVEGSKISLVTDHDALTYFDTKDHLSRRLGRWQETLAPYDYTWKHRPGRNNVADPISRGPHLDGPMDPPASSAADLYDRGNLATPDARGCDVLRAYLMVHTLTVKACKPRVCKNKQAVGSTSVVELGPRTPIAPVGPPSNGVTVLPTRKRKAAPPLEVPPTLSIMDRILAGYAKDKSFLTKKDNHFTRCGY